MEAAFTKRLEDFLRVRKQNCFPDAQKYNKMVMGLQNSAGRNTQEEMNLYRRYSITSENRRPRLLHQGSKGHSLKVVKQEDLFKLLHEKHSSLGHAGIGILWKSLRNYFGVSKEIIKLFVNLCEECQLKKKLPKRGVVVKPIISSRQNQRCQLDLIDMQSVPDGDFKFIMVYQDHLTKFVTLRPLKTKTAKEVVENLLTIFGTFGAPRILQSDNGREFVNQLLENAVAQWPRCKIVHGKPRHSQSQGSVERANADIEEILSAQQRENKSSEWAKSLPVIQFRKNIRYHSGIGRTPYAAMFGRDHESEDEISSDDDDKYETSTNDDEPMKIVADGGEAIVKQEIVEGTTEMMQREDEEIVFQTAIAKGMLGVSSFEELDQSIENIQLARAGAMNAQAQQARRMLEASVQRFSPVDVGQNVLLPIPHVDRPKIGARNLLGVVTECKNGFYSIGTQDGHLPQMFTRNQFMPCDNKFLADHCK